MSSQAERERKIYQQYINQPLYDPKVANEMWRLLQYANMVDDDAIKKAQQLLKGENL